MVELFAFQNKNGVTANLVNGNGRKVFLGGGPITECTSAQLKALAEVVSRQTIESAVFYDGDAWARGEGHQVLAVV